MNEWMNECAATMRHDKWAWQELGSNVCTDVERWNCFDAASLSTTAVCIHLEPLGPTAVITWSFQQPAPFLVLSSSRHTRLKWIRECVNNIATRHCSWVATMRKEPNVTEEKGKRNSVSCNKLTHSFCWHFNHQTTSHRMHFVSVFVRLYTFSIQRIFEPNAAKHNLFIIEIGRVVCWQTKQDTTHTHIATSPVSVRIYHMLFCCLVVWWHVPCDMR